jgi:hypothetical protein
MDTVGLDRERLKRTQARGCCCPTLPPRIALWGRESRSLLSAAGPRNQPSLRFHAKVVHHSSRGMQSTDDCRPG